MITLTPEFVAAIKFIAKVGEGSQYAFRGTTSLVLQGLDMGLQDIDLTGNSSTAHNIDRGLANFCVTPLSYSEHGVHKSFFGQYQIHNVAIEMMGEWQIKTGDTWSEKVDASDSQITHVNFQGLILPVTTIETELKCYALLRRFAVIHKIKRQLAS